MAKRPPIKGQRSVAPSEDDGLGDLVKGVARAGADVYGAAKALVPGVALKRGLQKAKGALTKITGR